MEKLTFDLVYATFVAQTFLFAIPMIVAAWSFIKDVVWLPAPIRGKGKIPKHLPVSETELQPLNCPSCGSGVPLNEAAMKCPSCGNVFPVPREYQEIRHARHLAIEKIDRAQRLWRFVSFLTSNWTLGVVIILTLWLTVCLVVILTWIDTQNLVPFERFSDTYRVPYLTLFFWIAMLAFIAISISGKFRSELPVIENIPAAANSETVQCANCGGTIGFDAGQFGSLCGYCGVETFRVKIARLTAIAEGKTAEKASNRLTSEMDRFADAIEDYLAVPKLLVAGLIILVIGYAIFAFGFVALLTLAVWAVTILIAGLLLYPIPTLAGLIALGILYHYRKPLIARFFSAIDRD